MVVCAAWIDYDDGGHTHVCDVGSAHDDPGEWCGTYRVHHCRCGHAWVHSERSEEHGQLI